MGVVVAWRVLVETRRLASSTRDDKAVNRTEAASRDDPAEVPKPIGWREPSRFGRGLAPVEKRTLGITLLQLGVFSSSAAIYLMERIAFAGARNAPTVPDLAIAGVIGWAATFGIPWMFRHSSGHVRMDHRSVCVVRLAALSRWAFLGKRWMTADPNGALMFLHWDDI